MLLLFHILTKGLSIIWAGLMAKGDSREYTGVPKKLVSTFAICITLYHVYTFGIGTYDFIPHRIIHVCSILALCFLTYTFAAKTSVKSAIVDVLLALFSLGMMVYFLVDWRNLWEIRMSLDPTTLTPWEIFMGVALILMLAEAARRAMGMFLAALALLGLIYMYIGPQLSGIWRHIGFSFIQIIDATVYTPNSLFTVPIGVSSTYIIMFMLFAGLIQVSGTGDFFTKLAYALAAGARGGPAKAAVVGSGFVGSISGTAVANVAITGSVTIPMMKRIGFEPHFAGAVEAAASTGGLIMPPVMAGVVFIMSELIGVPYIQICLAAAIPAVLYYLAIGLQVHFYSIRHGIGAIPPSERMMSIWQVLKEGWQHFLPFISIVGLLIYGYSPIYAALWSTPVIIIVSWFRKETRIGIKRLLNALEFSAVTMRLVMSACALAGILVGCMSYTGLGSDLVSFIRSMTGEMLLPALLLSAFLCLILGLPLSMVAAYLLTAILIVPATVSLGVPPISAHLFAIYFSALAVITPPTGGAFFQAASMAGAPPFRTGWAAFRLAFAAIIVPFVWVYKPALLLMGSPSEIVVAVLSAVIAIFFMAMAAEGWFLARLNMWQRGLLVLGAFILVFGTLIQTVIGLGLIAIVLIWQWMKVKGRVLSHN